MSDSFTLSYVSAYAPALPLGIGLVFVKRLELDQKILMGVMVLSLLVQFIALMIAVPEAPNYFLYHFYTPIEFIALGYIYKLWLSDWWSKRIFDFSIVGFSGFCIINSYFFEPFDQMNSNAVLVESILLIIFSIAFFYRILEEMAVKKLEQSPRFWINTSVLLYYAGSLLILGFTNLIFEQSEELSLTIWAFHSSFNILHYVLFGVGLWLTSK